MAEKPPVRVSGVDHIKVAPNERSVWWRKRKLGILALRVDMNGMAIPSMKLVVGAGDGKPDEGEKQKEHAFRRVWAPLDALLMIPAKYRNDARA